MSQKIAVICNYKLLPERIGGMDYFFWEFQKKCTQNHIKVDWFFPNDTQIEGYTSFKIIPVLNTSIEDTFVAYLSKEAPVYSVIITHFVALCTPFFKRVKSLSKAHIIAVDHNPRPLGGYPFKKKLAKKVKGTLYSKYINQFIAVSPVTKQSLIKDFGSQITSKTSVIYNGLNTQKFIQKSEYGGNTNFVIACHLRKEKGIQDVITAVSRLDTSIRKQLKITVFGEGYYKETLMQLVAKNKLTSIFEWKGSVTNLHEHYHNYDYLLHPSHGETFCYSVVESLLSHLPVITTKREGNVLGLVKEGKNGYLYPAGAIDILKNSIVGVVSGSKKIDGTYFKRENAMQDFSLKKMVQNYINLVKENK